MSVYQITMVYTLNILQFCHLCLYEAEKNRLEKIDWKIL